MTDRETRPGPAVTGTPAGIPAGTPAGIVAGVVADGDPARVRVRLRGEVDQLNADELVEAARPWLRAGVADVTVDLTDVVFIDSGGIGRIIGLWKTGRAVGVPVRLIATHQAVVALLDLAGLGRFMDVTIVPASSDPAD